MEKEYRQLADSLGAAVARDTGCYMPGNGGDGDRIVRALLAIEDAIRANTALGKILSG
jgi:hypothetical protein